jgi:hypothetical protein
VAVTEQHHQDRQADGRFCRGNRENKEHKHLAGDIAHKMQLDTHQQDDNVLAVNENTGHAQTEQHRTQNQKISKYHSVLRK